MMKNNLTRKDILIMIIKKLTYEKRYNDAENMLFDSVEKNTMEDIRKAGAWFYNYLSEINDEELEKNNFSKKEVNQGMRDLYNLLKKIHKF